MTPKRLRVCSRVLIVIAVVLAVLPPKGAEAVSAVRSNGPCGMTTLQASIGDPDHDGLLGCVPGDKRILRTDLAGAPGSQLLKAQPLLSFVLLSDLHQGDEELTLPSRTNWRNWAALAPFMLNAQVKAIDAIAAKRSPVTHQKIAAVFSLGDDADNAQYNEMRTSTGILAGGRLVDPNSGGPGDDDPNQVEPHGVRWMRSPVAGQRIVDLANQPFYAPGLHYTDGTPIPFYMLHGNHNTKVMGGIPDDDPAWRAAAAKWAVGDLRIAGLNARLSGELARIRDTHPNDEATFWMKVFKLARANPAAVGDVRTVTPDKNRKPLSREAWIDDLAQASGLPRGHGFLPASSRCPDDYADAYARRACWVKDIGPVRFIALDDSSLKGLTGGSIDRAQFLWLERQLQGASRSYFDRSGRRVINPTAVDRYIVVMSHHTSEGMHNTDAKDDLYGTDLRALLMRYPNVILHASGHSHSNRAWAHNDKKLGTGYWEVSTPSVIDGPHDGRTIELSRNANGTISIATTLFEPRVDPNPRHIDWKTGDPTDETRYGAKRHINEDWLASLGIEAAEAERAERRYGTPKDRNLQLVVADPLSLGLAVSKRTALPPIVPGAIGAAVLALVLVLFGRGRRPGLPDVRPRPVLPPRRPQAPAPKRVPVGASSRSQRPAA